MRSSTEKNTGYTSFEELKSIITNDSNREALAGFMKSLSDHVWRGQWHLFKHLGLATPEFCEALKRVIETEKIYNAEALAQPQTQDVVQVSPNTCTAIDGTPSLFRNFGTDTQNHLTKSDFVSQGVRFFTSKKNYK
jgi:hypothetical protein